MGEIEEVENGYMLEFIFTGATILGFIFIGLAYFKHKAGGMSVEEYWVCYFIGGVGNENFGEGVRKWQSAFVILMRMH